MDQAALPPAAALPGAADHERPLFGIALALMAALCFSGMDGLSKLLAADYSPVEIVWGRYVVILTLLAAPVLRHPQVLRPRHPWLQLGRGIFATFSALLFIAGLGRLPIADATAIGFASPLLVTAMSIPLLGERVGPRRWAAVATGFLGVLVVVRPGAGGIGPAALLPLASSFCWASSLVITRRLGGGDTPLTTLALSTATGFVLTGAALPFVWQPPGGTAWLAVAAMALLSAVGQYLLILGLARADASLLAPFSYSQMIWSTLIGAFVFDTVPLPATWCGAAIIVASGVYIAHRERLRRIDARAGRYHAG